MQKFIVNRINELVESFSGTTKFRRPLVGFVDAHSPRFAQLAKVAHPGHILPQDLLPGAKTVVAFFLPFGQEVVEANRQAPGVAREWAVTYIETNKFIGEICTDLQSELAKRGIKSAFANATHNFDEELLVAPWSHKHIAWAAGLGSFGLNHLLITPAGCAGRFGSLVLDQNIGAGNPEIPETGCLVKQGKACAKCVELCPTKALSETGLDKARCYKQLLDVDRSFPDLGLCDVCGKCSVGPCALRSFLD